MFVYAFVELTDDIMNMFFHFLTYFMEEVLCSHSAYTNLLDFAIFGNYTEFLIYNFLTSCKSITEFYIRRITFNCIFQLTF